MPPGARQSLRRKVSYDASRESRIVIDERKSSLLSHWIASISATKATLYVGQHESTVVAAVRGSLTSQNRFFSI